MSKKKFENRKNNPTFALSKTNKKTTTMLTAELNTPTIDEDDDDVVIDLDFPTPQTPEEARKEIEEIEEIEEEIRQGKFYTLDEHKAMIDKLFEKY